MKRSWRDAKLFINPSQFKPLNDMTQAMQNTKLVGLFHGATWSDGTQRLYYESEDMRDFALLIHATNVNIEDAKYHSSWDWLMPVWIRIKFIGSDIGKPFEPFWNKFHVGVDTDINVSWQACVEFIQWYNTQTHK